MDVVDVESQSVSRTVYKEDVQELAYQLWAFQCGRRVRDVAQELARGVHGDPAAVHERTIRRWIIDGGWVERVRQDIRSIAPDLTEQTIIDLIVGRREAVHYLRRVVKEANEPSPLGDQTTKAQTVEGEWLDVRARFVPNKEAITAAVALMDRGGLSHVGSKADPTSSVISAANVEAEYELTGKSMVELMQMEASIRAKR